MLVVTAILFTLFLANVLVGAVSGTVFLGDIPEMLLLLATSICFVIAILAKEQSSRNETQ